jgi:hypothetical protein
MLLAIADRDCGKEEATLGCPSLSTGFCDWLGWLAVSDISERVLSAADDILAAPRQGLIAELTKALQQFVTPDFAVGSGVIRDAIGRTTPNYPIVIFRAGRFEAPGPNGHLVIPADSAAVAIEVCDELDLPGLREAYFRVAEAKQLTKTVVRKGEARTNITLGVVLAARSTVSLDALANGLYNLDVATPHQQWLDMLVVLPTAVINYAVQFPGEGLSGDFMPPAEGAFNQPAPPAFFVTIVMRPTGRHSFNKLVAFVIGHLVIFAPDVATKLPNWSQILDGQPTGAITTLGFQPNLSGQLVPVPPEGYTGKFIPNKPVLLEGTNGELLAAITFVNWQNGGVIILEGKLPLDGMLVFLPEIKPEYLRVIKRPRLQISSVLPISHVQFGQFITNVLRRSNLRVRADPGGIVMERLLDEGTGSPFIARCMLGLLHIRENALPDKSLRDNFDKRFESAFSSLRTAREASKALAESWGKHLDRVASGEAAQIEHGNIRVIESVNKELSDEFESFLNAAARSVKTGVQGLCSLLGIDIGFLFKKKSAFEFGIERLRKVDAPLASYLAECRKWSERLILLRNDLEHEIWEFPKVKYSIGDGRVVAAEPSIGGEAITILVDYLVDRVICFYEEMNAHALQRCLPDGTTIAEIAPQMRVNEAPERFRITLAIGGEDLWRIRYHVSRFDAT